LQLHAHGLPMTIDAASAADTRSRAIAIPGSITRWRSTARTIQPFVGPQPERPAGVQLPDGRGRAPDGASSSADRWPDRRGRGPGSQPLSVEQNRPQPSRPARRRGHTQLLCLRRVPREGGNRATPTASRHHQQHADGQLDRAACPSTRPIRTSRNTSRCSATRRRRSSPGPRRRCWRPPGPLVREKIGAGYGRKPT